MKRITIISITLLLFASCIMAQSGLNSFYKYDTLYFIKDKDKVIRSYSMALSSSDDLWIYTPDYTLANESDSIRFTRINLRTGQSKGVSCYIPALSFKVKYLDSKCIAVDENHIALYVMDALIVLNLQNGVLAFNSICPFNERIETMDIYKGQISFGKTYNADPRDQANKTFIGYYDIKTGIMTSYRNPHFREIELTHFAPRHFISLYKNMVAFAQSTSYDITVYDKDFKDSSKITRDIKGFGLDGNRKSDFQRMSRLKNVKQMIDSLSPLVDTMQRIFATYFTDDTTILVLHYPNTHKKTWCILADVWKKKNTGWKFFLSDIDYCEYSDSLTKTIDNYPIPFQSPNLLFNSKYLVIGSSGSPISKLGKTQREFDTLNEAFYMKESPSLRIEVFNKNK